MRTRRLRRASGLFAAATLLLAAMSCGSQPPSQAETRLLVVVTEFAFTPAELTLPAGKHAAVQLQNRGTVLHDWNIDAIPAQDIVVLESSAHTEGGGGHRGATGGSQVHIAAASGVTAELRFTPKRAGEYTFYCTVPGHREAGMQGTLLVR